MQGRLGDAQAIERFREVLVHVQVFFNLGTGVVRNFPFYRNAAVFVFAHVQCSCGVQIVFGKFVPQCLANEGKILPHRLLVVCHCQPPRF